MTAANAKGQSEFSGVQYQYASAISFSLLTPELIEGTRTLTSVGVQMFVPQLSTTDVLGYQLYINEANTNSVPDSLIYDGQAISNVLAVTVSQLKSGQIYWLAYRVLNRAGWSTLSPYLHLVSGKLPQPPFKTPH
jgi:hypothetical protein